jgi:hypothetical protein
MENISLQEKIEKKETEIVVKILQLAKNKEIGDLLVKGSCTCNRCNVQWDSDLAKLELN